MYQNSTFRFFQVFKQLGNAILILQFSFIKLAFQSPAFVETESNFPIAFETGRRLIASNCSTSIESFKIVKCYNIHLIFSFSRLKILYCSCWLTNSNGVMLVFSTFFSRFQWRAVKILFHSSILRKNDFGTIEEIYFFL